MNKKSILGLLLFSCILIASMFLGTMIMIRQGSEPDNNYIHQDANSEEIHDSDSLVENANEPNIGAPQNQIEEEWFSADNADQNVNISDDDNISDYEDIDTNNADDTEQIIEQASEQATEQATEQPEDSGRKTQDDSPASEIAENSSDNGSEDAVTDSFNTNIPEDVEENSQEETVTEDALGGNVVKLPDMQLIMNSNEVDYMQYIPEMKYDSKIEVALDINNPSLKIDARSAILFDVKTRKVLYYKDPVVPVFPASTSKLLTALVALDMCMEEEEVTVGDELDLVAWDSTVAGLRKGRVLSIRNLIEGMLVPSGNDAAYVIATYVGRKSLNNENANLGEAIPEFIRLMNNKAKSLGAVNSSFKTPDGYDAIGQYTTAYDMGMIGLAAAENDTICEVSNKSSARNIFVDGHDVTWYTTNSLIKKNSGKYYSNCVGLKTGTSEMAGRCLISLGKKDGKEVISVIMDSSSAGRWEDTITLLNYGLGL